jgi:hypothetical protein
MMAPHTIARIAKLLWIFFNARRVLKFDIGAKKGNTELKNTGERTMIGRLLAIAAIAVFIPDNAVANTVQCNFASKVQCDPIGPCRVLKPAVRLTIDLAAKRYSRCDRAGCDTFNAVVTPSGAYTLIEVPGHAMFAKIGPKGKSTEVVSLMNSILVSQGTCR